MDSIAQMEGVAGAKVCEAQNSSWVENVDSDLLQEQTQSICEELQRRGACTTLALARHLGFEKSSAINSLMCLLLEKNVVVRVSDIPPIWYLSPTFPVSPRLGSSQFPRSSQPPSPLHLSFPPSVPGLFQCTPMLPTPVPAPISAPGPVNSAPAPTAPPTGSPAPALICNSVPAISSPALGANPAATLGPMSCVARTFSTPASEIPAVTPTVPPAPSTTPSFFSTCASHIPAPTVTPAPAPSPTPISTPAPAMTFLEHPVPVPIVECEEETEDEVEEEVAVVKTSPKTPLPAITFLEHLIPETAVEKKVSLVKDNPPDIKAQVLVPAPGLKEHVSAIPTPALPVVQEHKHGLTKRQKQRRRKRESDQRSRYFQLPVQSELQGTNSSNKRQKAGDHLTELQMCILHELGALGPTKTFDLSKRLGLVGCRDVNPSLYDLKKKNLVVRTGKSPIFWRLYEPVLLETEPEVDQVVQGCSDSDESW